MRFQTAPTGPGDSNGRRGLYPRPQQTGTRDNKYYRNILLNFIKFVVQEPQGEPSEKRPVIELMSFIIKLALVILGPVRFYSDKWFQRVPLF